MVNHVKHHRSVPENINSGQRDGGATVGFVARSEPREVVTDLCTAAVAAPAISAAWELGALDELEGKGSLDVAEFACRKRLDQASTLGLFRVLTAVEIVHRDGNIVSPGVNFSQVNRNRSFFHWVARGSAELFQRMPEVLHEENRSGDFYRRDPVAVAFACREINRYCYDPWFWRALESLDFEFSLVADLGCGSGERVLQILRRHPGSRAIGVDIAGSVLAVAVAKAEAAGLADRVSFIEADVTTLAPRPEFAEVDVLTCFMMGHDLWPRQRCVGALQRLRMVFPNVRRVLLGDATRTVGLADQEMPIFTLPFELGHDMMGTYLPTVAEWESAFSASGWRVRDRYDIKIAVGEVIFDIESE